MENSSEYSSDPQGGAHSPLYSGATPEQVAADLAPLIDFAADGLPLDELRRLIEGQLLPHLMDYSHPGFQSMFNGAAEAGALLGAQVALAANQGVTNWQVSPGGAMLEELCVGALCRLFDLSPESDATFMYSGTYANQQALYLALHRHAQRAGFDLAQYGVSGFDAPERLSILVSADAHFSLRHAVRMLGLGEHALMSVPVDENRRIDLDTLREIIYRCRATHDFFCMVATAGTTATGAVDPIAPMADLCGEIGAWLHVDGAYGYAYKLVPGWSHLFVGDRRADSITWDPHKQLSIPIPNSLLFLRDSDEFARMALHSAYFNRADDPHPNPGLKSPPSTRPMAALPLVSSLRHRGLDRIVSDLQAPLAAIRDLASELESRAEIQTCHTPDTGILCLRVVPKPGMKESEIDELQHLLYRRTLAGGRRAVAITTLDGRPALRLVAVDPTAALQQFLETIHELVQLAVEVSGPHFQQGD